MIKKSISTKFSKDLLRWYAVHGRFDLPWQHNKTAYRVWISEIMLQQTQVTTVIPYYQRFMQSFANVKQLALADEDYVLSHWSGLGYYARARNLHKTAQHIHQHFKGRFPRDIDSLMNLPGIGRSTAGAILSFAYGLPTTICDGNVKRVLARVFAISEPKQTSQATQIFWELATQLTPPERTADYNQAIMDIGATICTRSKPRCHSCPFENYCQAHQQQQETAYPVNKIKKSNPQKTTHLLLIENDGGQLLLQKRPNNGIWGGLWSLPECDIDSDIKKFCQTHYKLTPQSVTPLAPLTHKFSHYTLHALPLHVKVPSQSSYADIDQHHWHSPGLPAPGGVPGPVIKLLNKHYHL